MVEYYFAVFVRPMRVLPTLYHATRNFDLDASPAPSPVGASDKYSVELKIPHDGNRSNQCRHVVAVHRRGWVILCSVCATDVRVAHPVPCNS